MDDAFDEIWAIDWSGARAGYRGIAVARVRRGRSIAELIDPPAGAYWTRTDVVEHLIRTMRRRRLLVGFDFAFSLPISARAAIGLGVGTGMPALWRLVEARSAHEPDFYADGFVVGAPAGMFWTRGPRPPDWDGAMRATDLRAQAARGVRPESVLKLIGPKQVGRAALAGMRVLAHLQQALGDRVAIWPHRPGDAASLLVEIFPTLFRREALGGLAKIREHARLDAALAAFGVRPPPAATGPLSDDATDALVSAAGMRHYARRAEAFVPPADPRALDEGWIFGVPA